MTVTRSQKEEHDYTECVGKLRETFRSGRTKPLEYRRKQLKQLRKMITENMDEWTDALVADLGRHKSMAVYGDLAPVINSCDACLDNLSTWNATTSVSPQIELLGGKAYKRIEPKGVTLNMSPWNFPIELCISPVAYMIAGGNCVVIKPSEIAVNVAAKVAELVPKYLDQDAVAVVCGGIPETTALLTQKFDHILYTGNGTVGRIVMAAAAKHLTPVTLELGGKSPCVITEDCDMKMAAKRILNGKSINSGQICVAPDYVLVNKSVEDEFYSAFKEALKEFYPDGQVTDPSYSRMINQRHWQRVAGLLQDHGGEVVMGGLEESDEDSKLFVTTVVKNPNLDSRLMNEEIFGPVLPVIAVDDIQQAVEIINARDYPLALYMFSKNQKSIDYVLSSTNSGGVCVNDIIMHIVCEGLPFGGVGPSGMGCTHGQDGFNQFVHTRSVLHRGNMDMIGSVRYPPHDDAKFKMMKKAAVITGPIKQYVKQGFRFATMLVAPVLAYIAAVQFNFV